MCARCGDTIEASRCAARAGARANNTAHADVRVNGAARARAALAPTKPLATRSPSADAHVPRSRRRPIASLAAVMAAAAAGGGMHGYRWPQHAAIFVVVAIAARSKIGCERTGTRATSGSSSSLHITESRSRHSRSRRRPRERSHRCGGGGGERRRTIASLAAAGGGMHGYR